MSRLIDLTGQRFGKLLVTGRSPDDYVPPSGHPSPLWMVRCDCGAEKTTHGMSLRSGHARSCGKTECKYRPLPTENPIVACECGCGATFTRFASADHRQRHARRYVKRSHGSGANRWTPADDSTLRALYREKSVDEIGDTLGRSWHQVYERAIHLGITSTHDRDWETGEEAARRLGVGGKTIAKALLYVGIGPRRIGGGEGRRATNRRLNPVDVDRAMTAYRARPPKQPNHKCSVCRQTGHNSARHHPWG